MLRVAGFAWISEAMPRWVIAQSLSAIEEAAQNPAQGSVVTMVEGSQVGEFVSAAKDRGVDVIDFPTIFRGAQTVVIKLDEIAKRIAAPYCRIISRNHSAFAPH